MRVTFSPAVPPLIVAVGRSAERSFAELRAGFAQRAVERRAGCCRARIDGAASGATPPGTAARGAPAPSNHPPARQLQRRVSPAFHGESNEATTSLPMPCTSVRTLAGIARRAACLPVCLILARPRSEEGIRFGRVMHPKFAHYSLRLRQISVPPPA